MSFSLKFLLNMFLVLATIFDEEPDNAVLVTVSLSVQNQIICTDRRISPIGRIPTFVTVALVIHSS